MTIQVYLTFKGNCRQAMKFYQKCLGGELTFQTVGESPRGNEVSKKMKDLILHGVLKNNEFVLMASDMVDEDGLKWGNSIGMLLHCNSKEHIHHCYEKLSEGGKQTHPIALTHWGALFGDLTDKFGHQWLLNYQLITN